jgi:hypothetical protein
MYGRRHDKGVVIIPPATDDDSGFVDFDVHGQAGVRVARKDVALQEVRSLLGPFETTGVARVDLAVGGEPVGLFRPSHVEDTFRCTDSAVEIPRLGLEIHFGAEVRVNARQTFLPALVPVLDSVLLDHDTVMVHAAAISYRGRGVALPTWGGVGKAATVAKLLTLPRISYMGDDWAFLAKDGRLIGDAKPLTVRSYQRAIYPHLFPETAGPTTGSKLPKTVTELAGAMRPILIRHPQLLQLARRRSNHEAVAVTPRQAFPQAPIASSAPLATTVFLERYDGEEPVLEFRDPAWMATRLVSSFHTKLDRDSRDVVMALSASGLLPLDRYYARKAAILRAGLGDTPCFSLRVPQWMAPDYAATIIVEHLQLVFQSIGIT